MAQLLTAILNRDNMRIPAAMYFALNGIESRLTMVNNSLMELLHELKQRELEAKPEKPAIDTLRALWRTMIGILRGLKQIRNQIAHGQIVGVDLVQIAPNHHMAFPRLTSPVMNFSSFRDAHEKEASPGMTANDIHDHSIAVHSAAETVRGFEKCVRFIHAENAEALREKLAQLDAELRHLDAQCNPNSTKQQSQHQSSLGKSPKASQAERRDAMMWRADLKAVRAQLVRVLTLKPNS